MSQTSRDLILEHLRKTILGPDLYQKCKEDITSENELKDRLDNLHCLGLLQEKTLEDIIDLCQLNIEEIDWESKDGCAPTYQEYKNMNLIKTEVNYTPFKNSENTYKFEEYPVQKLPKELQTLLKSVKKVKIGSLSFKDCLLWHGSSRAFKFPYILSNINNRLTNKLEIARQYSLKATSKREDVRIGEGYIYEYSIPKEIKNVILFEGDKFEVVKLINSLRKLYPIDGSNKKKCVSTFSSEFEIDKDVNWLCCSKEFRRDIGAIFLPNFESQLITCGDNFVFQLKNIYKTKKSDIGKVSL